MAYVRDIPSVELWLLRLPERVHRMASIARYMPLIPMSILAPHIEAWIASNGVAQWVRDYHTKPYLLHAEDPSKGALKRLSEISGVPERKIYSIRVGEHKSRDKRYTHVSFDAADALLCAMDKVMLWHHPPLKEYYDQGIPVAAYERQYDTGDQLEIEEAA